MTEDELDVLVSIAIRRAEVLEDAASPAMFEAWREVLAYEEQLAAITSPSSVPGGLARAGAIAAAFSSGDRLRAIELSGRYLAEPELPAERRDAITTIFKEHIEKLAKRYPALAKASRLEELERWRVEMAKRPAIFPRVA